MRFTLLIFSFILLISTNCLAKETIFFHCKWIKSPQKYHQLIFQHDEKANTLIQIIQMPDVIQQGRVSEETKTVLSEFKISKNYVNYTKGKNKFSINRVDGKVLRDNQPSVVRCLETRTDIFEEKRAEIKNAKTTTTEFWSPTTGYGDTKYVKLGMLATSNEICEVFSHPFFNYTSNEYKVLDTVSSDFNWKGINAASMWIQQKFKEKGVQLRRFWLMENIHNAANENLSKCLAEKEIATPGFYKKLTRHFLRNLGYQGIRCIGQKFRLEQFVNDTGKISTRKIPTKPQSCIDFNFNSGNLNGWNTSTITLMLIWKEAHPVLKNIFDNGETVLIARLAENKRIQLAKEKEEKARQKARKQASLDRAVEWSNYQNRKKTLLEQVYNFATTGYPEGLKTLKWVEEKPCVVTDGNRTIDNRTLNMTAFRIRKNFIGSQWYMISSDTKVRLTTSANIPLDRLQKAWGLAFQECPGITSKF
jgi:hypothetical protein